MARRELSCERAVRIGNGFPELVCVEATCEWLLGFALGKALLPVPTATASMSAFWTSRAPACHVGLLQPTNWVGITEVIR